MKQLASYVAIVLATLGILLLIWQFREVVALFILSLLVTAMLRPLIAWFVKQGIPAATARALIFIVLLLSLALIFYFFGGQFVRELQELTDQLALAYEVTFAGWDTGTEWQQAVTVRLPHPTTLYEALAGTDGILLWQTVFGVTQSVLGAAAGFLLVLVLSNYWSSDQERFERLWLSLLPAGQRVRARNAWRNIETAMGDYLNSEFLQSLLAALLIGVGMTLLGVPYPILLGLISGIAWLIPLVGAILIIIATFLAGSVVSPFLALGACLYALVVLCLLEFVVQPQLFNSQRYSSLLIILFMWPMAHWLGLGGLILAPPLAAATELLMRQLIQPEPTRDRGVQMANLEKRYQEVSRIFTERDSEPRPPEIGNILTRLQTLIQQIKTAIPEP